MMSISIILISVGVLLMASQLFFLRKAMKNVAEEDYEEFHLLVRTAKTIMVGIGGALIVVGIAFHFIF